MRLEYGFSQGERGRSYGEIQGRTPNRLLTKTGQPCAEFLHPRYATYSCLGILFPRWKRVPHPCPLPNGR